MTTKCTDCRKGLPCDAHRCVASTYSTWGGGYRCSKRASMTHEGKGYCGIHDPVKKAARQAERDARWKADWDARDRAREEAEERERQRKADLEQLLDLAQERGIDPDLIQRVREANL